MHTPNFQNEDNRRHQNRVSSPYPLPTIASLTPNASAEAPTEADFDALLPPLHQVIIPCPSRRRAHTLDVEWGASSSFSADWSAASTEVKKVDLDRTARAVLEEDATADETDGKSDDHVHSSSIGFFSEFSPIDDQEGGHLATEGDDDNSCGNSIGCGSLEEDLVSLSDDFIGYPQRGRSRQRRSPQPATTERHYHSAASLSPSSHHRIQNYQYYSYSDNEEEEEEGTATLQSCRQSLTRSRCVRGFLTLCVYYVLVLEPSRPHPEMPQMTIESFDQPTPEVLKLEIDEAARIHKDRNHTILIGTETRTARHLKKHVEMPRPTTIPLSQFPHFHRPRTTSTATNTRHVVTRGAAKAPLFTATTSDQQHHHQQVAYDELFHHATATTHKASSMGAAGTATHDHPNHPNDNSTHWVKVPPIPPPIHPPPYHKRSRPILSYAHSYQLHQEPLVFGQPQSTSFFSSDSTDILAQQERRTRSEWANTLIWLSLICLCVDTTYREYQHYRWYRRYVAASSPVSQAEQSRRRNDHERRSPSPVIVSQRRNRYSSQPQQEQQPQMMGPSTAGSGVNHYHFQYSHNEAGRIAAAYGQQQHQRHRGRRRFDSY